VDCSNAWGRISRKTAPSIVPTDKLTIFVTILMLEFLKKRKANNKLKNPPVRQVPTIQRNVIEIPD
jgi:hypothetical protein